MSPAGRSCGCRMQPGFGALDAVVARQAARSIMKTANSERDIGADREGKRRRKAERQHQCRCSQRNEAGIARGGRKGKSSKRTHGVVSSDTRQVVSSHVRL